MYVGGRKVPGWKEGLWRAERQRADVGEVGIDGRSVMVESARAAAWEDGMSGKMRSPNLSVGDLLPKVEKERPSQGDARDEGTVAAGAAGAGVAAVRAEAQGDGASQKMRSSNWLVDELLMKVEKGSVWRGIKGSGRCATGSGGVVVRLGSDVGGTAWGEIWAAGVRGAVKRAAGSRTVGVGKGRRRCVGMNGE